VRILVLALLTTGLVDCRRGRPLEEGPESGSNAGSPVRAAAHPREPVRVEVLAGITPPVYALRGGRGGPDRIVFLHGLCGHGLGYAQSFQNTAAERGALVAPQGDVPCGDGPWARWSADLDALDARITQAFVALGHAQPIVDRIVIGYSQGATRAESLARRFPDRYTRVVLIGGPYAAKATGLSHLRAAVTMAGDRDRRDLMQAGARVLEAAKIPATFLLIPGASHGSMGSNPERTMAEVFAWISEHQRAAAPTDAAADAPSR
jgi:pimeloyl-ACP methyl ester carboxylesterase